MKSPDSSPPHSRRGGLLGILAILAAGAIVLGVLFWAYGLIP